MVSPAPVASLSACVLLQRDARGRNQCLRTLAPTRQGGAFGTARPCRCPSLSDPARHCGSSDRASLHRPHGSRLVCARSVRGVAWQGKGGDLEAKVRKVLPKDEQARPLPPQLGCTDARRLPSGAAAV